MALSLSFLPADFVGGVFLDSPPWRGKQVGNQDQENRGNFLYKQDLPFKNNKLSRYIKVVFLFYFQAVYRFFSCLALLLSMVVS